MFAMYQIFSYILKFNDEICHFFFNFKFNVKKICYNFAQICMNEMFENNKLFIF